MASTSIQEGVQIDPVSAGLRALLASRGPGVVETLRSDAEKLLRGVAAERWEPNVPDGLHGTIARLRARARRAAEARHQADYLESVAGTGEASTSFVPLAPDDGESAYQALRPIVLNWRFPSSVEWLLGQARHAAGRARSAALKVSTELQGWSHDLKDNRVSLADYQAKATTLSATRDALNGKASAAEAALAGFGEALGKRLAMAIESEQAIAKANGESGFDLAEALYEVATIGGDGASLGEDAESRLLRERLDGIDGKLSAIGVEPRSRTIPAGRAGRQLVAERAEAEKAIKGVQAAGREKRRAEARAVVASALAGEAEGWQAIHGDAGKLPQSFLPGFRERWAEAPLMALRDVGPAGICMYLEMP